MKNTEQYIIERAKNWTSGNFDSDTKKKVQQMIDSQSAELTDAFYRDLEFGTGGLRGIMGALQLAESHSSLLLSSLLQ